MKIYGFWNNKGGTGKTSLLFQAACRYAETNLSERILILDLCPQANLSELLLGGLMGGGSNNLDSLHGATPRVSVGGYFEQRLPSPYSMPSLNVNDFLCIPSHFNSGIAKNIKLLAGDPLLELQSNAIATLANAQIPGQNPWLSVVDWLNDFLKLAASDFDVAFVDTNPSFAMYTQIALSACELLVLPVMPDDSSRRAVQNALALIHGVALPSAMYANYSFTQKLTNAGRQLPQVHLLTKNRLTQYMGSASAYASVMQTIEGLVESILQKQPQIFTFANVSDGFEDIRDFGTTGVVAFAKGLPFSQLKTGKHQLPGREVQISKEYLDHAKDAVELIVSHL